jgi:hypothetical protein
MNRTAQIIAFPQRHEEALADLRLFLSGRSQVDARELVDWLTARGWRFSSARTIRILMLDLGWSSQRVSVGKDGSKLVYNRPSPIADGWRPRVPPRSVVLDPDPDREVSRQRQKRWDLAFLLFGLAASAYFLSQLLRAVL